MIVIISSTILTLITFVAVYIIISHKQSKPLGMQTLWDLVIIEFLKCSALSAFFIPVVEVLRFFGPWNEIFVEIFSGEKSISFLKKYIML